MKKLMILTFLICLVMVGCDTAVTGNIVSETNVRTGTFELEHPYKNKYFSFSKGILSYGYTINSDIRIDKIGAAHLFIMSMYGTTLNSINKDINNAELSDCNIVMDKHYLELKPGTTMCIKTQNDNIAMIGVEEFMNNREAKLTWKNYPGKGCTKYYYKECVTPHTTNYKYINEKCQAVTWKFAVCRHGCDESAGTCK